MGFAQTIETRDFTSDRYGGPYTFANYDGADVYTARGAHDYRVCAVTKDGEGVYLGLGAMNDPRADLVSSLASPAPPATYESSFLRRDPDGPGFQVWPAPAWWDQNAQGLNALHLGAVFI